METNRYFVFDKKVETEENIIFIGKEGDFPSLEKFLEKTNNHNIYDFTKNHLHLEYFDDNDVFISKNIDAPLEIRLSNPLIPRKCSVITSNKKKLKDIIAEKEEYQEDYDIFSGNSIKNLKEKTKLKILKEIILLIKVLYQMLDAGYLNLENNKKIDDWIVLFQEPILDLFIRYHKFPTSAEDVPIPDEFIINPYFRREIIVSLMKVIANFTVNNGYVDPVDISKFESWENLELWEYLKENYLFKKARKF